MKNNVSLQIQAVLYNNHTDALERSLFSLANAVCHAQKKGLLHAATLVWGDASPQPLYSPEQLATLQKSLPSSALTLQYRFFDENTGYGKGHNLLFASCESDFLFVINPDITVCHDCFEGLLAPFGSEEVGLTEARQTPVEHPKKYDPKTGETPWSSGACFVMPSSLYRELGGFDEAFFMYSEDVDLSFRIRQKEKKLIYCPDTAVYHSKHFDERTGALQRTPTETRFSIESQLILAYKWKQKRMLSYLKSLCRSGDDFQKAALQAFTERLQKGELKQITGKTSVFKGSHLKNRYMM